MFKFQETTNSFVHIKLGSNVSFRVQDIEQDINGVIWLATSQGLYGFKEDEPLYTVADLKNVEVTDIELINQNKIWFSSNGKGIYVKDDTVDPQLNIRQLTTLSLARSRVIPFCFTTTLPFFVQPYAVLNEYDLAPAITNSII